MADGESGRQVLDLGVNGYLVVQKVECGKVRAKPDQKTKGIFQVMLRGTMCATQRCMSSGCMGLVTRSLFLMDEEREGWH